MPISREKKQTAGCTVLHPLHREGSDDEISRKGVASLDPYTL